ncbi:PhzF family phenazine biosynthesis protein [Streptomyces sp. 7-21]|uniref:PhzF family phenazine biosynthesis protein n=1 Tax=Streptomyces sp. 7-21 TaxID=2802283 RepID=UPI00191CC150|nr:PhzF family phenazine biosynthesis protein [Streptomyces sp. 7-21]MBL1067826.1 PhzF family phenazine biosynthesis protein [Streptomyces sp. 7-21]
MRYRFVLADVFTDQPFGGNQLAVFPDARGLPESAMAALAREFNFSEITFVLPPQDEAHTCRVRIFTPAGELPFAGHPTVGTAAVLAAEGTPGPRLLLEEGVGVVPVDVSGGFARLTVSAPFQTTGERPPAEALAAALSVAPGDIADTWYGGVGLRFCYVRLTSRAAVDRVEWAGPPPAGWASDVYVFAGDFRSGGELYARSFVPGAGITEDPATGSACAGLVASLAHRSGLADGAYTLRVEQGVRMGRPSRIAATAQARGGRYTGASVGGDTVIVGEGTLSV